MSDMRAEAVKRLVERHGSYRAAAAVLGMKHAYLWRIAHGEKNPSDKILKKLGLRREVHYVWCKPEARKALEDTNG